jgi:glycosyltransferase involved in cell wall biosynthesis
VYDTEEGWINRYHEKGIQSFDRFIAINKRIEKTFVERLGMNHDKIDLIYPVLNEERVEEAMNSSAGTSDIRAAFKLPTDKRLFLFNGRLTKQKRPLDFLKLALSRKSQTDEHFVMLGDGELSDEVTSFIERNRLSNITRITFTDKVFEILKTVDGLIITSSYEGLPIAMLEALCMQVPVLSTDVGDIRLILEQYQCGEILPEVGNTTALKTVFMLWKDRLPVYHRALAAKASQICQRFSARAAASQYQQCWNEALKTKARNLQCA